MNCPFKDKPIRYIKNILYKKIMILEYKRVKRKKDPPGLESLRAINLDITCKLI